MPVLLVILLGFVLLWVFPRSCRLAWALTMFVLCALLIPALIFLGSAAWVCRVTLVDPPFHRAVFREVGMYPALSAALARTAPGMLGGGVELGPSQRKKAGDLLQPA